MKTPKEIIEFYLGKDAPEDWNTNDGYRVTLHDVEQMINIAQSLAVSKQREKLIDFANAYHSRALDVGQNCEKAHWFVDDFIKQGKITW